MSFKKRNDDERLSINRNQVNVSDEPKSWSYSDPYGDDLTLMKRDGLKPINFFGYSIGHVYNDLCATAWFTYLLFFLKEIVKVNNTVAS